MEQSTPGWAPSVNNMSILRAKYTEIVLWKDNSSLQLSFILKVFAVSNGNAMLTNPATSRKRRWAVETVNSLHRLVLSFYLMSWLSSPMRWGLGGGSASTILWSQCSLMRFMHFLWWIRYYHNWYQLCPRSWKPHQGCNKPELSNLLILCFVDIWSTTDNTAVCMDNLIITIMIKST